MTSATLSDSDIQRLGVLYSDLRAACVKQFTARRRNVMLQRRIAQDAEASVALLAIRPVSHDGQVRARRRSWEDSLYLLC